MRELPRSAPEDNHSRHSKPLQLSTRLAYALEQVATTINGISAIGHARTVLERAGWVATISADRITVDHDIVAQLLDVNGNMWWQVYADDGTSPAWIVGAADDPSSWAGAE
jgi:hypothetical protein